MAAFLYIDLHPSASQKYGPAILSSLKQLCPGVATLDLDANSGDWMVQQAKRLLTETDRVLVCIKADEQPQDLGSFMLLLEELLHPNPNRLLILLGQQPRLLRMFQARPQLYFKHLETEVQVLEEARLYFA
jgi:hypothetical protein